jgi:large subunit ribosomal protein L35
MDMPKMKTNKAASKRFTKTASGQLKRFQCNKQHQPNQKTSKRLRRLRKATLVDKTSLKRVTKVLPYL